MEMIWYRTARGAHRHTSWECANLRRHIHLGEVTVIPPGEAAGWAPCTACCDTETVGTHVPAAASVDMCDGWALNPKRIESKCAECEYVGKVQRRGGKTLRTHKKAGAK